MRDAGETSAPAAANEPVRARLDVAIQICSARTTLRRTILIAAVVGLVLTAINEGDSLVHGAVSAATAIKVPFNFLVPFVVSNLGVLAGQRPRASAASGETVDWADAELARIANRRSEGWLLIALGTLVDVLAVGGMSAAIVWTSGADLAAALVVGNLVLVAGFLVAYRGRLRSER